MTWDLCLHDLAKRTSIEMRSLHRLPNYVIYFYQFFVSNSRNLPPSDKSKLSRVGTRLTPLALPRSPRRRFFKEQSVHLRWPLRNHEIASRKIRFSNGRTSVWNQSVYKYICITWNTYVEKWINKKIKSKKKKNLLIAS